MGLWQWIFVALVALDVGFITAKHGEYREPYNIWTYLISGAITVFVLFKGGFFG
jgi:hypothetical protein